MILKSAFVTLMKTENKVKRIRRCLFDDVPTATNFVFEMGKQGWDWKMEMIEYYPQGDVPDVPKRQQRLF